MLATVIPLPTLETLVGNAYGQPPIPIVCEADQTFPPTSDGRKMDGYVLPGPDGTVLRVIHLRQSICDAAQASDRKQPRAPSSWFTFHGQRVDEKGGYALGVLMHEATHIILPLADESTVECTSFQNAWQLVRRLSVPAFVRKMLLVGIAARHDGMPPDYRKAGC